MKNFRQDFIKTKTFLCRCWLFLSRVKGQERITTVVSREKKRKR